MQREQENEDDAADPVKTFGRYGTFRQGPRWAVKHIDSDEVVGRFDHEWDADLFAEAKFESDDAARTGKYDFGGEPDEGSLGLYWSDPGGSVSLSYGIEDNPTRFQVRRLIAALG